MKTRNSALRTIMSTFFGKTKNLSENYWKIGSFIGIVCCTSLRNVFVGFLNCPEYMITPLFFHATVLFRSFHFFQNFNAFGLYNQFCIYTIFGIFRQNNIFSWVPTTLKRISISFLSSDATPNSFGKCRGILTLLI